MNEAETPRDEELSRLYRDGRRGEPPAALDRAILEAAAQALEPAEKRRSFWQRWQTPVVAFATVLLTATLTLLLHFERRETPPAPAAERGAEAARDAAPAATAPAPAAPAVPAASAAKRAPVPVAPRLGEAPVSAFPADRPTAEPSERRAAQPEAGARAAAKAQSAEPGGQTGSLRSDSMAAPAAPAAAAGAPQPARPAADAAGRSPAQRLDEIRRLRRDGRRAEADAALTEFRRLYPDYPLPADLSR